MPYTIYFEPRRKYIPFRAESDKLKLTSVLGTILGHYNEGKLCIISLIDINNAGYLFLCDTTSFTCLRSYLNVH